MDGWFGRSRYRPGGSSDRRVLSLASIHTITTETGRFGTLSAANRTKTKFPSFFSLKCWKTTPNFMDPLCNPVVFEKWPESPPELFSRPWDRYPRSTCFSFWRILNFWTNGQHSELKFGVQPCGLLSWISDWELSFDLVFSMPSALLIPHTPEFLI